MKTSLLWEALNIDIKYKVVGSNNLSDIFVIFFILQS